MNSVTKEIIESETLQENILKWNLNVPNVSDLIKIAIDNSLYSAFSVDNKWHSSVSVTDILEKLELTKEQIIEGWPNLIIKSTTLWREFLAPIYCQDIYVAVYLEKNGAPNSYDSYAKFMRHLDVSSNLYRICLSGLWKYLSDKRQLPDFFASLKYTFWTKIYGKEWEKEFDTIAKIIKNIPSGLKDDLMSFINNSDDHFVKKIRLEFLKLNLSLE